MNFGIVPETALERVALWLGLVPIPIVDLLFGSLKVRVIMAGVRLGIFEALRDKSRTSADLAEALRLDGSALESLLRVLTHVKYLEAHDGRYRLSSLARRSMIAGAPMELTGYARWHSTQWEFLEHLETLVRTGAGVDLHQTLERGQPWADYQRAMLEASRFDVPALVRLVPIPEGATRLIDIGGGHGLLGAEICRKHPPMRSTVIDLPQAIEHGRTLANHLGFAELVDYQAGDVRHDQFEEADAALLANVLHHLSPSEIPDLLCRVHTALRPSGTIAIWELEAPGHESHPTHGDLAALFFRLMSKSEAYHGTQYANWLTAAGFRAVRVLRPWRSQGRVLVLGRA